MLLCSKEESSTDLAAISRWLVGMRSLKRNWYELLYLGLFILYSVTR
jgi:hypothetical protein